MVALCEQVGKEVASTAAVKGEVKTQLIAHDQEVYDIAFKPKDANTFASVGADGSVRMFDLRSLKHSKIIYEEEKSPLLRLCWNKMDENYLAVSVLAVAVAMHALHVWRTAWCASRCVATCSSLPLLTFSTMAVSMVHLTCVLARSHAGNTLTWYCRRIQTMKMNESEVIILDIRSPCQPFASLGTSGHKKCVNGTFGVALRRVCILCVHTHLRGGPRPGGKAR